MKTSERAAYLLSLPAEERREALERMSIDVPIVVRLDGTEAEEGRRLLADAAPPNVHPEATMLDAARRVVELAASASGKP